MRLLGTFRDGHPRTSLALLDADGGALEIEFIVDTGFDGDLALPGTIARRLPGQPSSFTKRALADGTLIVCPVYELTMAIESEVRNAEVLVLPGSPLLGTTFLMDSLLTIEMTEDGEVTAESL